MNLYMYLRVYNYDCEEKYLVKANTEEEALAKIVELKKDKTVDKIYLELIDFCGEDIIRI